MGTNFKDSRYEDRHTAASYVLNFYNEVMSLTDGHAQYLNFIKELEAKYPKVSAFQEATPEEKHAVTQAAQTVRYYAHKCYVLYECIRQTLNVKQDKKIKDSYQSVKNNLIPRTEDLENLTIQLNSFLITNIMSSLLQTSQDLIERVYDNG